MAIRRPPGRTSRGSYSGGTGSSGTTGDTRDTATRISTGGTFYEVVASVEGLIEPGLVPLYFYSTTNATGQWLRPGTGLALSECAAFRGSIAGIAMTAQASCSGTYTAYFNGVATGAALTVSSGTSGQKSFPKGQYDFAAGTKIDIRASGVSTSTNVQVTLYLLSDPNEVS